MKMVARELVLALALATGLAEEVDRTVQGAEEQRHTKVAHWCNSTLPPQEKRIMALQQVMLQAQSGAGPMPKIAELQMQSARLAAASEKQRAQLEAEQHQRNRHLTSVKLDYDGASKSVNALLKVKKKFGSSVPPKLQQLLQQAQAEQQKLQAALKAAQQDAAPPPAKLALESEHEHLKKQMVQLEHQHITAQRSLDVLVSALDDESAYLADMQTLCSVEQQVHQRLSSQVFPKLQKPAQVAALQQSQQGPADADVGADPPPLAATLSALPAPQSEPEVPLERPPQPKPEQLHRAVLVATKVARVTQAQPAADAAPPPPPQEQPAAEAPLPPQPEAPVVVAPPPKVPLSKPPGFPSPPSALSAPKKSAKAPKSAVSAEVISAVAEAAPGNLPASYTAWSPDGPLVDKEKVVVKAPPSLADMKSLLAGDGDVLQKLGQEAPASTTQSAAAPPVMPPPPATKKAQQPEVDAGKADSPATEAPPTKPVADAAPVAADPAPAVPAAADPAPAAPLAPAAPVAANPAPPAEVALVTPAAPAADDPPPAPKPHAHRDPWASMLSAASSDPPPAPKRAHRDPWASMLQSADEPVQPKAKPAPKKVALVAGNVPQQYDAWSPNDNSAAAAQKKADIAALMGDFGDDDDAPAQLAPARHAPAHAAPARRALRRVQQAPAVAAPPRPASHAKPTPPAPIVYDDDDLPKHHKNIFAGLEGGWQDIMKKQKLRKPKQPAQSTSLMSLWSLPSQYTAWSPDSSPAPAAAQPVALPGADQFSADLAGFVQVSMHAAASATTLDSTSLLVATTMLQEFADVFQSKALHQLAKAQLDMPKLMALYQKLQAVDPSRHPGTMLKGKQGEALRWCTFFESNEQSATPLHATKSQAEKAADDLAEAATRRAAILEEVAARTQLEKTVAQDMRGLSSLLEIVRVPQDASLVQRQLVDQGFSGADEATIEVTMGVGAAGAEIEDVVQAAMKKRKEVQAAAQKRLAKLKAEAGTASTLWSQRNTSAARAKAAVESVEHQLNKVGAKCDGVAAQFAGRRHQSKMEIQAVVMAIRLLGGTVDA